MKLKQVDSIFGILGQLWLPKIMIIILEIFFAH